MDSILDCTLCGGLSNCSNIVSVLARVAIRDPVSPSSRHESTSATSVSKLDRSIVTPVGVILRFRDNALKIQELFFPELREER
jgi:hypothetical protein